MCRPRQHCRPNLNLSGSLPPAPALLNHVLGERRSYAVNDGGILVSSIPNFLFGVDPTVNTR
jgi:hypothetical protein